MRWMTPLGLALAPAACMQTIIVDQGADGGGGTSFDGGLPSCAPGSATKFQPESPEVMVVLDRSSGMNSQFGNSTELAAARDALDLYGARYQNAVFFGYVEFPGAGQPCNSQMGCCASTPSLPNSNFAAFGQALHACELDPPYCVPPTTQRPMVPALASARSSFSENYGYHQYLILITNGEANCGSGQNPACNEAVTTVQQMKQRNGIPTMVIVPAPGQLDDQAKNCLQQIALQGGAFMSPYYRLASTPAELTDTLGQMTGMIAKEACHLDPLTSAQIKSDNTVLQWRGTPIPYEHNDGWDVNQNGFTIDLNGMACERFIEGDPQTDLKLFTGCDPPRR